jgi:hypothetical protein
VDDVESDAFEHRLEQPRAGAVFGPDVGGLQLDPDTFRLFNDAGFIAWSSGGTLSVWYWPPRSSGSGWCRPSVAFLAGLPWPCCLAAFPSSPSSSRLVAHCEHRPRLAGGSSKHRYDGMRPAAERAEPTPKRGMPGRRGIRQRDRSWTPGPSG